jgi:hypothetical protein
MVRDRLRDGTRIAQLLASEIEGGSGCLAALSVVEADPDVEPTTDGAFAFAVAGDAGDAGDAGGDGASDGDGASGDAPEEDPGRLADVFVQPDRVRVEFRRRPDAVASTAEDAELRVRPRATRPPRTLVFLEDGAEVKRVLPAFEAAASDSGE